MLSATDIKNAKFAKAMSGYKQEDVDILLDQIESDYTQFDRIIRELQSRIEALENENVEFKDNQTSIQNVLLSAQRLADRIVTEAKEKSEEIIQNAESNISVITAKQKELSANFELKAADRKERLERELAEMVRNANLKAESIMAAANDSVARQQLLYDKLKMEIASLKTTVSVKIKEHIESFNALPDSVLMDPTRMAEIVSATFDKEPDPQKFIPVSTVSHVTQTYNAPVRTTPVVDIPSVTPISSITPKTTESSGFVVGNSILNDNFDE